MPFLWFTLKNVLVSTSFKNTKPTSSFPVCKLQNNLISMEAKNGKKNYLTGVYERG